jgi:hypothetical protein
MELLIEQRRQDMIKEAEQARLINQVRVARRTSSLAFYRQPLAALGRRLILWGEQLQDSPADAQNHRPITAP